jgi:hypothetical protein
VTTALELEPPAAIAELKGLQRMEYRAERPCVYFLCLGDQVRYVGQTLCLQARLENHRYIKDFDRVYFVDVPKASLGDVERQYIQELRPPDNGNGWSPRSASPSYVSKADRQQRWPDLRPRPPSPAANRALAEQCARDAASIVLESIARSLEVEADLGASPATIAAASSMVARALARVAGGAS